MMQLRLPTIAGDGRLEVYNSQAYSLFEQPAKADVQPSPTFFRIEEML